MEGLTVKTWITTLILILICITPINAEIDRSLEQIFAETKERWSEIKDLSLILNVYQYNQDGHLTGELKSQVLASQQDRLLRMEIMEPEILEDQIYVLDERAQVLKMYLPVMDQIVVRSLEEAMAEFGFNFDLASLTQLPDPANYNMEIMDLARDDTSYYMIKVKAKESLGVEVPGYQIFWLNRDDLIPRKITAFGDDGNLLGVINLSQVAINPGISPYQLAYLPEDAWVIEP